MACKREKMCQLNKKNMRECQEKRKKKDSDCTATVFTQLHIYILFIIIEVETLCLYNYMIIKRKCRRSECPLVSNGC